EDATMPMPPEPMSSHIGYDEASGCALWQRAFIRAVCKRLGIALPKRLALPYRMSMAIVDLLEMAGYYADRHAWVPVPKDLSVRPGDGDIVYIGGSDGTYEHVFCVDGDYAIEGGVIVKGHQGVLRDPIGWHVVDGALHVGKRRVNGWIDCEKVFA